MIGHCYAILDAVDNRVKYIGQTRLSLKNRLYRHVYGANCGSMRRICIWLRSIQVIPEILEIGSADVGSDLDALEMFMIASHRSIGLADLNVTSGGSRHEYDDLHCSKMSEMATEIQNRPDVKRKKSVSMNDPTVKSRQSMRMKETCSKPEVKEKRSRALREAHRRKREQGLLWRSR